MLDHRHGEPRVLRRPLAEPLQRPPALGRRQVLALEARAEHVREPAALPLAVDALVGELPVVLEQPGDRVERLVADDALGRLHRRHLELGRAPRRRPTRGRPAPARPRRGSAGSTSGPAGGCGWSRSSGSGSGTGTCSAARRAGRTRSPSPGSGPCCGRSSALSLTGMNSNGSSGFLNWSFTSSKMPYPRAVYGVTMM